MYQICQHGNRGMNTMYLMLQVYHRCHNEYKLKLCNLSIKCILRLHRVNKGRITRKYANIFGSKYCKIGMFFVYHTETKYQIFCIFYHVLYHTQPILYTLIIEQCINKILLFNLLYLLYQVYLSV